MIGRWRSGRLCRHALHQATVTARCRATSVPQVVKVLCPTLIPRESAVLVDHSTRGAWRLPLEDRPGPAARESPPGRSPSAPSWWCSRCGCCPASALQGVLDPRCSWLGVEHPLHESGFQLMEKARRAWSAWPLMLFIASTTVAHFALPIIQVASARGHRRGPVPRMSPARPARAIARRRSSLARVRASLARQ